MKAIEFSSVSNPLSWDSEEFGSITFASHEEAKKAERLFQQMADEIMRLRSAVPEEKATDPRLDRALSALRSFDPALADHIERLGMNNGEGSR